VGRLQEKILAALKLVMGQNHNDDTDMLQTFLTQASLLRSLSHHHIVILSRFKEQNPDVDFPALHKELFSVEAVEMS